MLSVLRSLRKFVGKDDNAISALCCVKLVLSGKRRCYFTSILSFGHHALV